MRPGYQDRLRCPRCKADRPFDLSEGESNGTELRTGALTCRRCRHVAAIEDGFVDLMHDPPDFVVREAAGLERFAELMRSDGWDRERVVALPDGGGGYWYSQAVLMDQVLRTCDLQPGETLLDLGSNTCWASAEFARHGLDVTALDISTHVMQGLRTADWQMEDKEVFFERVLAMMFDLPFADGSFDRVFACEVLHHNHRANLARTLRECHRVLRPGGQLIVVNEPFRNVRDPKIRPGHEVAEFEGHEHAYMRFSYTRLARRAGFEVDVRAPWLHGLNVPGEFGLSERMNDRQILSATVAALVRRRPWAMKAILAARAYVTGHTSLHMVCTRPA